MTRVISGMIRTDRFYLFQLYDLSLAL